MKEALLLDSITRLYGDRPAVTNISLQIPFGGIHGFLGPNGAGKTTTLKMICGLLPANSGRLSVLGENPFHDFEIRKKIGFLMEDPPLYVEMKVEEFLKWLGSLYHIDKHILNQQMTYLMENLKLNDVKHRLISNLSKGYRQRVAMAAALIHDPQIIILDEPMNGLDPNLVIELREFILSLKGKKTIIFSSHILSEVEMLCDTVSIIHQGELKFNGSLSEIRDVFKQRKKILVHVRPTQINHSSLIYQPIEKKLLSPDEEKWTFAMDDEDIRSALVKYLVERGIEVIEVRSERPHLEEIFQALTQGKKP